MYINFFQLAPEVMNFQVQFLFIKLFISLYFLYFYPFLSSYIFVIQQKKRFIYFRCMYVCVYIKERGCVSGNCSLIGISVLALDLSLWLMLYLISIGKGSKGYHGSILMITLKDFEFNFENFINSFICFCHLTLLFKTIHSRNP